MDRDPVTGETTVVRIEGIAVGGDGLGRWPDGRVAFVPGALPGEEVAVELDTQADRHVRAVLTSVRQPSSERREPPCVHRTAGCGGCDWMHVAPAHAAALKAQLVSDELARIDGLGDVTVAAVSGSPALGYRTTVRAAVEPDGAPAFHVGRSAATVAVDSCPAAHPAVEEVLATSRFPDAAQVVIRVGARTGQRLVMIEPAVGAAEVPVEARLIGADELDGGRRAWIFEEVAGRRWRLSARSFFQTSPEAAEAIVDVVARAIGPTDPGERLVDLYAGVGLFAGTLGRELRVTAVESSPDAAADARVNLADLDARIVRSRVEKFRPRRADVVVADPPRRGLGTATVGVIDRTGADRLALVSCDVGALVRDAKLLQRSGWRLAEAGVVDAFPQTSQAEVVTGWRR